MPNQSDLIGQNLVRHAEKRLLTTPLTCLNCEWTGRQSELITRYPPDGMGDVYPVDFCPLCESESIVNSCLIENE